MASYDIVFDGEEAQKPLAAPPKLRGYVKKPKDETADASTTTTTAKPATARPPRPAASSRAPLSSYDNVDESMMVPPPSKKSMGFDEDAPIGSSAASKFNPSFEASMDDDPNKFSAAALFGVSDPFAPRGKTAFKATFDDDPPIRPPPAEEEDSPKEDPENQAKPKVASPPLATKDGLEDDLGVAGGHSTLPLDPPSLPEQVTIVIPTPAPVPATTPTTSASSEPLPEFEDPIDSLPAPADVPAPFLDDFVVTQPPVPSEPVVPTKAESPLPTSPLTAWAPSPQPLFDEPALPDTTASVVFSSSTLKEDAADDEPALPAHKPLQLDLDFEFEAPAERESTPSQPLAPVQKSPTCETIAEPLPAVDSNPSEPTAATFDEPSLPAQPAAAAMAQQPAQPAQPAPKEILHPTPAPVLPIFSSSTTTSSNTGPRHPSPTPIVATVPGSPIQYNPLLPGLKNLASFLFLLLWWFSDETILRAPSLHARIYPKGAEP